MAQAAAWLTRAQKRAIHNTASNRPIIPPRSRSPLPLLRGPSARTNCGWPNFSQGEPRAALTRTRTARSSRPSCDPIPLTQVGSIARAAEGGERPCGYDGGALGRGVIGAERLFECR